MEKTKNMFLTSAKELKTTSTLAVCAMLAALALILNSCLLNQSCDGKEDKGINWPHNQVLYSTHWEDCKEAFSVEHVQP